MNRREFLGSAISAGAALLLSGCRSRRASGKIELTYNTFWTGRDAHATAMNWIYKEFQPWCREQKPEIDFQVVQVAGGAMDNGRKLMAELAAGGGPDIIHDTTYDHVRAGYLLDLTEHIAPWKDRFIPEALASCTWDGKILSLPTEYSMVPCIWNMRVLDKVDRGVPSTWEEYLELGRALKKKGIALTCLSQNSGHIFFSVLFSYPNAVELIANEEWEADPFLHAVEALKEIRDAGLIPDNDIELQWGDAASLFQNNDMAHYMNGAWTLINEITADGVDPELRNHLKFSPFPSVIKGSRPIRGWVATKSALNSTLAEEPEKLRAAIAFYELFTSHEAAKRFVSMAHSPQGVKLEWDADLSGKLLYDFFDSRSQATSVFVLPNNPGAFGEQTQARALPDISDAIDEGMSAKKALSYFAEVLRA